MSRRHLGPHPGARGKQLDVWPCDMGAWIHLISILSPECLDLMCPQRIQINPDPNHPEHFDGFKPGSMDPSIQERSQVPSPRSLRFRMGSQRARRPEDGHRHSLRAFLGDLRFSWGALSTTRLGTHRQRVYMETWTNPARSQRSQFSGVCITFPIPAVEQKEANDKAYTPLRHKLNATCRAPLVV